jgi:hypothetical protein
MDRFGFAVLAVVAVVAALVVRAYPDYDTYYALVWGRELMAGQLPSYTAFAAATPHPLFNLVAGVVGLVGGSHADRWMVALCAFAHAVLACGVYRLGSAVANRAVGAIAAALIAASPMLLEFTSRGHVDIPFLALVVWASVAVVERPDRSGVPMLLLAVAGLLRPEAWVLAGLLWIWRAGRSRRVMPALLAGVLAAPALWMLTDLAVTGDPLFSLHATHEVSQTLGRPRGFGAVTARYLPSLAVLIPPLAVVAGIGGGALAWLWRERLRGLSVLAALMASGTATFALFGAVGLPVLPRYLTIPAVGVSVLAGLLVAGWTLLPGLSGRATTSVALLIAVGAGGVVFASLESERASDVAAEVRYFAGVHDDLHAILNEPAVAAGRRCGPVSIPAYLQLPDVRWHLDADRYDVVSRADSGQRRRWGRGVALVALGGNAAAIGTALGLPRRTNAAPPGFTEVARNGTFAAYVRCE